MARRGGKKAPYRNRPVKGFHYVGNRLVPNEGTVWNEENQMWDIPEDTPPEPQPIKQEDDPSLINGGGDYDQGSEINTALGKNEIGQDMMQTDTYGISGDESTKTTKITTHFEGVDYAALTDKQIHQFTLEGSAWTGRGRDEGWIWADTPIGNIKINKYGTPWQNPNKKHFEAAGAGEHDEEGDNVLTADDEGRFPGEPGFGKGPDWEPPFQTGGVDDPSDAEIAFMMDDSNYGIGGELLETNTQTGANIETFELGAGYGNEGGWKPTPKGKTGSRGKRSFGGGGASAESGNLRRSIRKLSPSLITAGK